MNRVARLLVPLALLLSPLALAQATEGERTTEESAELKQAKDLVTRYLNAVKAKKWGEAKKHLHPQTLKSIAERKKRLGREDHPMAPWYHEKVSYYLKAFQVTGARVAALGTFVIETSEDNFQVEEKGMAEGEMASYLVGKKGGKWFVVDKKRGESFTDESIRLGYKGYFDRQVEERDEEE